MRDGGDRPGGCEGPGRYSLPCAYHEQGVVERAHEELGQHVLQQVDEAAVVEARALAAPGHRPVEDDGEQLEELGQHDREVDVVDLPDGGGAAAGLASQGDGSAGGSRRWGGWPGAVGTRHADRRTQVRGFIVE